MYRYLHLTDKVRQSTIFLLVAMIPVMLVIACSSGKSLQKKTTAAPAGAPETMCHQIVRFHIERAHITNEDGTERDDDADVQFTVIPGERHLLMAVGGSGKINKIPLKSANCKLTGGMKGGEAVYELIETERYPDGTTKDIIIQMKLQASEGALQMSMSAQGKPGSMKAAVTRWEVVNALEKEMPLAEKANADNDGWRIDASKKIYSKDSIVRNGYTLQCYVQSPNFDTVVKRRMIETFFTVYPKEAALFNPDAPKTVIFNIDPTYTGVAAALGSMVRFNPKWFAENPEDIDVVTHEVMHVVQGYDYSTVPFWVTEGIADYGRAVFGLNNEKGNWRLEKPAAADQYQAGYKTTARFFLWLEQQYKLPFVTELNKVAAAKAYSDAFWETIFGKPVAELWNEYRAANDLGPQPQVIITNWVITKTQAKDSLVKAYATRDSLVQSKFEVSGEYVFAPNVLLPPGYPEGSRDYLFWYQHPIFAERRHTLINWTVGSALAFASEEDKMQVIYDSARLFPALDPAIFSKRYCFDIIVSKEQEDDLDSIFIERINSHFKIKTRVDTLERTVLVLKKLDGFVYKKPDEEMLKKKTSSELFMQGIMEPYILIANFLNSYTDLPVLDETGLKEAYDFGFRFGEAIMLNGSESKAVAERLEQHGLRLERAVRKYPALVITR